MSSSVAPRLPRASSRNRQIANQRYRVNFERRADVNEFDDVESSIAVFILRDEGLGPSEPVSECLLRKASINARNLHTLDESAVSI